jgi:hypothetical protein
MPAIVADPPALACYHLIPGTGIQECQELGPDPFAPRGRDARGGFATEARAIRADGRPALAIHGGSNNINAPSSSGAEADCIVHAEFRDEDPSC